MAGIINDTLETYVGNLKLVLLFSIPFIIAFLIPVLAPLPTYITSGGIFLRSASIFINLNILSIAIIIIPVFVSLLFLSFALVAISLIVKSTRTHVRTGKSALQGIEKYTASVFLLLVVFQGLLIIVNVVGYFLGISALLTAVVGFLMFMLIFYAPSAMVIDNKKMVRAIKDSAKLVTREPAYFLFGIFLLLVSISIVDAFAIGLSGTLLSRYLVLLVSSLIILPFFVIYQAEAYMKRFPIIKNA
ncbi:MAG TPA: hypothetical protein VNF06_03740 [Candidatus Aquilonibacter sp.]|nr:hypothetical protein [Candidatus Aquilonibacter sp.]